MVHGEGKHRRVLDSGLALLFPWPNSFTGETVAEFQIHGGPVILDQMVAECCRLGARNARPGEFSERAFLNGKMDLTQAEAIADLIDSSTDSAARSALRSLQGEFSLLINQLVEEITRLRVYTESAIDFPEEEVDFLAGSEVERSLNHLIGSLDNVMVRAQQGALLREGMQVVIAGKPNAGKSSLLNALAGQDAAIVTAVPGTTRDVLREKIQIEGMPLHIIDTAGLRTSGDDIEQEGIRRAWVEIEKADQVLLVVDSTDTATRQSIDSYIPEELRDQQLSIVYNKADISGQPCGARVIEGRETLTLSAKTGEGIDLLQQHLLKVMGYQADRQDSFSARRRHLDALRRAANFLEAGKSQLLQSGAGELLAEDLRQCQQCLGEITGTVTPDDLLGEIFSSFCIGK
jgi:tRNA modification GTPase